MKWIIAVDKDLLFGYTVLYLDINKSIVSVLKLGIISAAVSNSLNGTQLYSSSDACPALTVNKIHNTLFCCHLDCL